MNSYNYTAYGLHFASAFPLPQLTVSANGKPDITISYGEVPDSLAAPAAHGLARQSETGKLLLNVSDVARYLILENREIVIFVSSIHRVRELGLEFVFTDQHAYAAGAEFYSDTADLRRVDWQLLRERNFKTDDADPGKQLRYQAEALIHRHVPLQAILGIGCHNDKVKAHLEKLIAARNHNLGVKTTPAWYF